MPNVSRPAGLFLIFLTLLAAALVARPPTPPRPVYDPAGNGPDGLLLLREWLREMGYDVATTGRREFAIADATLLLVYPGVESFSAADADRLTRWVEEGGTLVLVDSQDAELMARFDFAPLAGDISNRLRQSQPLLPGASAVITGTSFARRLRLPSTSPAVTLVSEDGPRPQPAAALMQQGKGWVWLLGEDFSLTNERLTQNRSTAQIVPALLRAVPEGGRIRFDTYHLLGAAPNATGGQIGSLQEWAYTTPSGWAALFLLVLGFGFLILQGRRLGPPIQTAPQSRRREAAEFVVAMAGLQRRAGVRQSMARHQRQRVKQRLGRPWQLPADLPDGEFLDRLAAAAPGLGDEWLARLRRLLADLASDPDEATLVALAQEADWLLRSRSQLGPGLAQKDPGPPAPNPGGVTHAQLQRDGHGRPRPPILGE